MKDGQQIQLTDDAKYGEACQGGIIPAKMLSYYSNQTGIILTGHSNVLLLLLNLGQHKRDTKG